MRFVYLTSIMLVLWLTAFTSAQEAKGSVRINNLTDDERIVEINTEAIKLKAQFESVITVPAGDFTYKIIGINETALRRHVKAGETWSCTIRATLTILPSDKALPPNVDKVTEKIKEKTEEPEPDRSGSAKIVISVPTDDAIVTIDGVKMTSTGKRRQCYTPVLAPGQSYFYIVAATWNDGGTPRTVRYKVTFKRGDTVVVDFTK